MKKNISINISGIIFHIEEDGFDSLKKYLDSINRYFSTFEDSTEILADIESRIAEIFLSKLNEGKQVITAEDVNALMATMGSVRDFKAAEEEDTTNEFSEEPSGSEQTRASGSTRQEPKQLVRDQKRKILGGICAGIAHYANVDPVWIRLLFALSLAAYGITLLIYVVLWIAMPGSYDLEELPNAKKMFRDPEKKALAGVSGGLAAYFGIDLTLVRILFIVFTFLGGLGLFIYIVLWIALPEAHSLTDKMKMQGEPVTLSNIESNIKKGLNVKEGEEENVLVKILLFPFRLLAFLITGLAKVLHPLLDVIRVAAGIIISMVGFSLIFSTVVAIGIVLGLFTFPGPWLLDQQSIGLPLETIQNLIPGWMVIAAFFAASIPGVIITLLGITIIGNKLFISAPIGWSLFILFFVSIAALSIGIPQIVYTFKEEAVYKVEKTFQLNGKTAVLRLNEAGMDNYRVVDLTLRGYEGSEFKLVESYEGRGSTRQLAIENARMVEYSVEQKDDSILVFDSNIRFREDAVFRAQRLYLTLYIPYNYPFVMDEDVSRFITQYVSYQYLDGYTWHMTPKGLECITCPVEEMEETEEYDETENVAHSDLTDFNNIEISGVFDLTILPGDEFAVEFSGPDHEKTKYEVYRVGNTLVINYDGGKKFNLKVDKVKINITMPELDRLEAAGFGTVRLEKLLHSENMEIDLNGPVKLRGEIQADHVIINLNGKSEADLSGNVITMNADVKFASKLKAYRLEAEDAYVDVNGASSAKVNVTGRLEMKEGLASDIDYRGKPEVIRHN